MMNELSLFLRSACLFGRSAFKIAGIEAFIMIDLAHSAHSLNGGLNIGQISGSKRHPMTFIGFLEFIEKSIALAFRANASSNKRMMQSSLDIISNRTEKAL